MFPNLCFCLVLEVTFFFFFNWQVVNRYIDEGVAELVPGVLFIDEVLFSIMSVHVLNVSWLLFIIYLFVYLSLFAGTYAGYGMLFILESCFRELTISNSNLCHKQRVLQCEVWNSWAPWKFWSASSLTIFLTLISNLLHMKVTVASCQVINLKAEIECICNWLIDMHDIILLMCYYCGRCYHHSCLTQ